MQEENPDKCDETKGPIPRITEEEIRKQLDMLYKATKTRVKTRCGLTQYFNIDVKLHQGSTLNPLSFIIIMDVLASSIQRDPPWAMLFADDLVICEESRLEVEQHWIDREKY